MRYKFVLKPCARQSPRNAGGKGYRPTVEKAEHRSYRYSHAETDEPAADFADYSPACRASW